MKDKKCSEFVFMPLREKAGGSGSSTPNSLHQRFGSSENGGSKDRLTPVKDFESSMRSCSPSTVPGKEVRSKIVVVGSCGCGKSALIHRYVNTKFLEAYSPTGFETHNSQYSVSDSYKIHMSIWDTSGDAGFDGVRHLSYAEADLVIICFAVDDPSSMDEVVTKWYPEIREHCPSQPVMLVGCKSDRRNEIKAMTGTNRPPFLTYDQGLKTAKLIKALVYSETSARSSQRSVNDVMEVAALSSAGSKNGSTACSSGTTTTASNGSNDSRATTASSNSSGSGSARGGGSDSPNFSRQRSFIRRKRFNGMAEAKVQLRKEAAKSCVVM